MLYFLVSDYIERGVPRCTVHVANRKTLSKMEKLEEANAISVKPAAFNSPV